MTVALEIAGAWLVILTFAVALGKAAAKPTPKPERDRPVLVALDAVEFDWPGFTPGEAADAGYREGFRAGRSVERTGRAS